MGGVTPAGVADFADLLRELDALGARIEAEGSGSEGPAGRLARIRFTTSHPIDASDKLWEAMRDCPRVCGALHLPVQSGSDRVLRRMKRLYRRDHYLERVASLRRHVPDIVLTTDMIVGFCGETEEDFEETMSLVREVRFDQAYMFMYSPRAGTPAADRLPDDVPADVKKTRLQRLIALQEEIAAEKNAARVGATFEVMIEGAAKRPEGSLMGRTDGDIVVNFPNPDETRSAGEWAGEFVSVIITESSPHTLRGTVT
jgi:tRNA-2-methylthio-N6-dimethylallyladenosine synthase